LSIHVFVGPTLRKAEVLARLDAVVAGPAAFGDVYRAARQRPSAIAIIDGYFEHVPSTWHKEILWAMAEGVHVFGASSMGALRAAELCDFGMQGVGTIFEAFRAGELEDDDEVAVAHGAADTGFLPVSEAMVNIRASLRRSVSEGVLGSATASALIELAKRTFYAERSYPAVLAAGAAAGISAPELEALRAWLREGRVDQKRADAEQLLEQLKAWQATDPKPFRAPYSFESTDAWHEAERFALAAGRADEQASSAHAAGSTEAVLEELKLENGYPAAHTAAAALGWSIDAARRAGVRADALAVRTAVETFRRDAGLSERQAFERWRSEQHVTDATLTRFFEDRARAAWAEPLSESLALTHLVSHLQASGAYGRLRERAAAKQQRLTELGLASPSLADLKLGESELWSWYFATKLGREPPSDLEAFARSAGFSGAEELRRAALRERCFEDRGGPNLG
jgi:hypothetical protein